mmetsp:Transcript_20540/g.15140  ORF Transcript_20540/g.15140 Transcript_20540/m.15140 type:complete len:92 (+) Transcript_20540:331-606(+)
MLDLNVKSVFFTIKECRDLLVKGKDDPNILLISSSGAKNPFYRVGVYSMTKQALNHMPSWLAVELMDYRIRVNSLAPGLVPTKMSSPLMKL